MTKNEILKINKGMPTMDEKITTSNNRGVKKAYWKC
jgi:hypothetical protein